MQRHNTKDSAEFTHYGTESEMGSDVWSRFQVQRKPVKRSKCPCLRKKQKNKFRFSLVPRNKAFSLMTKEEKSAHARKLWGVVRRHMAAVRF